MKVEIKYTLNYNMLQQFVCYYGYNIAMGN